MIIPRIARTPLALITGPISLLIVLVLVVILPIQRITRGRAG